MLRKLWKHQSYTLERYACNDNVLCTFTRTSFDR